MAGMLKHTELGVCSKDNAFLCRMADTCGNGRAKRRSLFDVPRVLGLPPLALPCAVVW